MNRTVNRLVGASKIKTDLRCCFGGCTSDNKYASLTFLRFPKPCFRVKNNLVTSNKRHIDNCADCRKCQKWISLCSLSSSISDADKNAYVCTLHFVDRQPSESFPDPLPAEEVLQLRRARRNIPKKRRAQPAVVEKTVQGKHDRFESCDFTIKAAKNRVETKLPTAEETLPTVEKKPPIVEKKLPTAKEKLRGASKANLPSTDFDPLDLNNLLLSTTSIFQKMCKELKSSIKINEHDYLNMNKEQITLTTSAGDDSKQSLQIVVVNRNREDATPSFSESTNDLERMLTDVESTMESAEMEYQETFDTRTTSTQTDNRPLEMENKKLKLEIATLQNHVLCLQNQIRLQDIPKLLVVCDDE